MHVSELLRHEDSSTLLSLVCSTLQNNHCLVCCNTHTSTNCPYLWLTALPCEWQRPGPWCSLDLNIRKVQQSTHRQETHVRETLWWCGWVAEMTGVRVDWQVERLGQKWANYGILIRPIQLEEIILTVGILWSSCISQIFSVIQKVISSES